MDPHRFDSIARIFSARRLSRRAALSGGGAGLAAAGLAAAGLGAAAAQEATPAAEGGDAAAGAAFMFVQSFQNGTLSPKAGGDGAHTLTLEHGLGQTVYFSDRPERIVGAAPTGTFLQRFPFGADNPPNAALVVEAATGETDVVVFELTAPTYDEGTRTATYDAKVLDDYQKLGLTLQEEPKGADALPAEFGAASLFIDDCPDGNINCYTADGSFVKYLKTVGFCWTWNGFCCKPCQAEDFDQECNAAFPDGCQESCGAEVDEEYSGCS